MRHLRVFGGGRYSECLTRRNNYVVYYGLDPMRILVPSTDAQGVLRIMDDRPFAWNADDRES